MKRNLELTQGRTMSEAVMMALTRKGMDRQKAHELIRQLAIKSEVQNQLFKETLLKNDAVQRTLSEKEVDEALDPRNYLGTAVKQVDLAVQKTKRERKARGLSEK